ncbi:hypothetical protein F5X98DRAFT_357359 [Xylaria grammica]|nr:hypothetical protein F5X98DRAFT_357359 [Xylaria grammica]
MSFFLALAHGDSAGGFLGLDRVGVVGVVLHGGFIEIVERIAHGGCAREGVAGVSHGVASPASRAVALGLDAEGSRIAGQATDALETGKFAGVVRVLGQRLVVEGWGRGGARRHGAVMMVAAAAVVVMMMVMVTWW